MKQTIGRLNYHTVIILKATSWRVFGSISTVGLAWAVTQRLDLSLQIGAVEFVGKIGLFYFHERVWKLFTDR